MSDKAQSQGHWETQSYSSETTKIGNNPSVTVGQQASAEGTFDHGKPVVTDSHATSFTDQGHPGKLEYQDQAADQQKSIK